MRLRIFAPHIPTQHLTNSPWTEFYVSSNSQGVIQATKTDVVDGLVKMWFSKENTSGIRPEDINHLMRATGYQVEEIVMDTEYGNIEAVHVPFLLDTIKSSPWRVLDLWCSHVSESKIKLERDSGIQDVVYMDNSDTAISMLQDGIGEDESISRRFVVWDKNNLTSHIENSSISCILRLGVFDTNAEEIQGLHDILEDRWVLFVSNNIFRQPPQDFTPILQERFSDIDVYLWNERYIVIARKGN